MAYLHSSGKYVTSETPKLVSMQSYWVSKDLEWTMLITSYTCTQEVVNSLKKQKKKGLRERQPYFRRTNRHAASQLKSFLVDQQTLTEKRRRSCCWSFYTLATSQDISAWVPTSDNVHSWQLHSATPQGDQAASCMTWYPTHSHYLHTEPTNICPILIMPNTWLGSAK